MLPDKITGTIQLNDMKLCLLCGKDAEMEFNSVVINRDDGKSYLIRSGVCFDCFGGYPDDGILSQALVAKALADRGLKKEADGG